MHCVVFQIPNFENISLPHYTIVQTVFKLGSNRTAFPSTDFAFVSYIGFSKAACPLLFSCTEHPVYCVLGAVLLKKDRLFSLTAVLHTDTAWLKNLYRIYLPVPVRGDRYNVLQFIIFFTVCFLRTSTLFNQNIFMIHLKLFSFES